MSLTARPKTTAHARKRQGAHHRHSKTYMNTYWPYLPMIAIIAAGILANSLLSGPKAVLGIQSNYNASTLLSITNADRSKDGESALTINTELASAAQAKANDMVRRNYWSHTSPSGETAEDFIIASGYQFSSAGENLAYGFSSARSVMSAWMNSPEHKANILDINYKNVGFGVAESPNYLGKGPKAIVVAEYAEPSGTAALGVVNQPPIQTVSRLDSLAGTNATWPEIAMTVLITLACATILFKHAYRFRKLVVESEEYIIKHPFFDIAIVFLATLSTVLSHSSGLIG